MNLVFRILKTPFINAVLVWIVLGILGFFLVDSCVMPLLSGQFKGKVTVPALKGLSPEEAEKLLSHRDLVYMLDTNAEFSPEVAAGLVFNQFPESGKEVKNGRRVWVKVSRGAKSVEVPALRGLSLRQAEISLQQLGLVVGDIVPRRHSGIPKGAVIGTNPSADTELARGTEVTLYLSEGRHYSPQEAPSLVGMTLSEAKEILAEAGIKVGELSYDAGSGADKLPLTVLAQTPAPGKKLERLRIDLVVSKE